jgi:hypothetical protein
MSKPARVRITAGKLNLEVCREPARLSNSMAEGSYEAVFLSPLGNSHTWYQGPMHQTLHC